MTSVEKLIEIVDAQADTMKSILKIIDNLTKRIENLEKNQIININK